MFALWVETRVLEAEAEAVGCVSCFQIRGWDSYQYLNYKMEAEAEAEAVEAALKSTASTSLV